MVDTLRLPEVTSVSLRLLGPEHGWLRVELRLDAYVLSVPASLVLNDPLRELFDLLACDRLSPHAFRRTCLWQEPKGHAIDVEKLWDDRLMLSVCFDTDFVPPMTGRAMDLVYRC